MIVSHDRHLLGNTVDEFYSIHQGVFAEFSGDLKDYEKWLSKQETVSQSAHLGSKASGANSSAPKLDKKQQRQEAAARREKLAPLKKREKALEREIDRLNQDLIQLEEQLSDASLYEDANKAQLTKLLQQQGEMKSRLADSEEAWMQILEELGA